MPDFRVAISGLCCAILAGCAGGDSDFDSEYDAFIDRVERAAAASDVGEDDLPSEASLSGHFAVQADTEIVGADGIEVVLGELSVHADFAGATVGGAGTNLGIYNLDCTDDECDSDLLQSLDGSLTLDGTITSDAVSTTASGTFDGQVSGIVEDPDLGSGSFVADTFIDFDGGVLQDADGLMFNAALEGEAQVESTFGDETFFEGPNLAGSAVAVE